MRCFFCAQVACLHEHELHLPLQLYSSKWAEHGLGIATWIVAVSGISKISIHALDFSLSLQSTQGGQTICTLLEYLGEITKRARHCVLELGAFLTKNHDVQHLSPFKASLLFKWGNKTKTAVSALLSSHAGTGVEMKTASNICHDVRVVVDLNHHEPTPTRTIKRLLLFFFRI